jgi:hypothetical protein
VERKRSDSTLCVVPVLEGGRVERWEERWVRRVFCADLEVMAEVDMFPRKIVLAADSRSVVDWVRDSWRGVGSLWVSSSVRVGSNDSLSESGSTAAMFWVLSSSWSTLDPASSSSVAASDWETFSLSGTPPFSRFDKVVWFGLRSEALTAARFAK